MFQDVQAYTECYLKYRSDQKSEASQTQLGNFFINLSSFPLHLPSHDNALSGIEATSTWAKAIPDSAIYC